MDFPPCKFDEIKTVTTRGFLSKFYKVVTSKIHIHHSHVTGEIHGYAHDFCNWQVRENNTTVSLIGHNFLGFDIYVLWSKALQQVVGGTTELSMGGTNLTNVNFANVLSQVKIIDTLKYYQTTLANLSSTMDKTEKNKIEEGIQSFLKKHVYFCKTWHCLSKEDKDNILNMIAEGKGVMPYEKITDIHSLSEIVPEDDFFKHKEFYSSLKQINISLEEYENVNFLYKKLQMRNLGDMNDLYNVEDVIILCEIIENRFEQMYQKFGFNPRKCNSASTLSGCIQREPSKVIITLPTNFEHAAIFEKTLTGGYSCLNNRLGFDTEVLLPSFTQAEYNKMNIDETFQNYKNQAYKVGYKLKLNRDDKYKDYRVLSKLIKFDENNPYGFAMTKPMATGSIKEKLPLGLNLIF